MKKVFLFVAAIILGISAMYANPVDVETAKSLGQKFVQAKFELTRAADLELYYTVTSDNGQPCAYVFNMGNEGFVIVAASDNVRPILGYSNEGPFDASNPYNGAMYMLHTYKNSISHAIEKNIAPTPDIEGMWKSLENCGKLSNKRAKTVGPLVQTKWNQNSPYNLYAPAASGGPGGRCYAGCVATAMSQVMRYWNHPAHGTGSHSYQCPGYGVLSANFGATNYDWDNMPLTLNGANETQIDAVAKLMYHCGVAVDMGFEPNGSGANSQDVPVAMSSYFDYNNCQYKRRDAYSLANWINLLKADFDLGRPVYYSGYDASSTPIAGHAFVADGYNEDDFIHFNFGWSGSNDNWYAVDAIDYNSYAAAVFNYVPTAVYNNTVQAPTNLTATKTSETAQQATIRWTNPTKTLTNQSISTIDEIVVEREGVVIGTITDATPGAQMSFVDENVPCFSTFEYKVYAVYQGARGAAAIAKETFGPTCQWRIIATTTNMGGWNSAYIIAYDAAGHEVDRFTMTNNSPADYKMNIGLGKVTFVWKAGTSDVTLSFKIKDSAGNIVSQYEGLSNGVQEGELYSEHNRCGNTAPTEVPGEAFARKDGNNIIITWSGSLKTAYGFNVYRDGLLCALVQGNQFVDVAPTLGGHCYQVCYITEGGESALSNEVCATAGEGCNAPRSIWYYLLPNRNPAIMWTIPSTTTGLSGYFLYRKIGEDGEYERIKALNANKTEYKEMMTLEPGTYYYYKIVAYYQSTDCYSAPAKSRYFNEYFVKILYDPDGIAEAEAQAVEVYPNPVKDMLVVKAENISNVVIYNSIGQKVFEQNTNADELNINTNSFETGIYMVRIIADGNEVTRKISVVK